MNLKSTTKHLSTLVSLFFSLFTHLNILDFIITQVFHIMNFESMPIKNIQQHYSLFSNGKFHIFFQNGVKHIIMFGSNALNGFAEGQ